jgi:hypothetical protein
MYKVTIPIPPNNKSTNVIRLLDGAYIPFDSANTDYQAFLRWCEEGNTPLPADEA